MSEADMHSSQPIRLLSPPRPAVEDTVAWIFALSPIPMAIIVAIIDLVYSPNTLMIQAGYASVFITLRDLDKKNFQARNVEPPSIWWFGLAPGYLWRRASILHQSRIHFWTMLAAMVAGAFISLMIDPN